MSAQPKSRILGVGAYTPERVLTNRELEKIVDTSDEWIRERTGIHERRIAADGESTSDMALRAAERALEMAGLGPQALDLIVVGTVTPDMPFPSTAAFLQHKLGAGMIPSFDIGAACAGFIYGLSIADRFIGAGAHRHVLVVGVELLSRVLDWQDRGTCVLFGDGAGAAVLGVAEGNGRGVLSTSLHTDGALTGLLSLPGGGSREPMTVQSLADQRNKVHMMGQEIFRVAVKNLAMSSEAAMAEAGVRASDIDWVVPHQANIRILKQLAERLAIPIERFVLNIDRYGNTSSASVPIALDEAWRDGRIKEGQTVLVFALGSGVSWASAIVRA
jgi:3-oxoacyl-[acyl-carrier-protein] synthase III